MNKQQHTNCDRQIKKEGQKKNVICLSQLKVPSVHLCGDIQLDYLAKQGMIDYQFVHTLRCSKSELEWADILVFIRSDDVVALRIAKAARAAGKYCIYVLDDDLLHVPGGLVTSDHYHNQKTIENICAIMNECQCFLSPSTVLLEKYGRAFARCERIEEPALAGSSPRKHAELPVRIGFAGTVDRARDIDNMLTTALTRVMDQYGEHVEIIFFGALPELAKDGRVRHIPYQDSYDAYRQTMEKLQLDIGLAPMPETPFHSCKHYNKYIEYASFGIAGVYSDVIPYRFAIRNEENGLLVSNGPESWYTALCRLINDSKLREAIRQNAYRDAKNNFTVKKAAEIWEQILKDAASSSSSKLPKHLNQLLSAAKIQYGFLKMNEWGWKTPGKLARKVKKMLQDNSCQTIDTTP